MSQLKIVVHYRDGRIIKGTTNNFWPESKTFHLAPLDAAIGDPPFSVSVDELKGLFIVRDFEGDPSRVDMSRFQPGAPVPYGQKLEVIFEDGEVLEGVSLNYDENAAGFFLLSPDSDGNNERMFVVRSATTSVRRL